MQCPRCGYPNQPLAAWCAQCGLTLPSEQASRPSAPAMSQPVEGAWRGDSLSATQDEERPSWLLDALRSGGIAPGSGQDQTPFAPPPAGTQPPQSPLPQSSPPSLSQSPPLPSGPGFGLPTGPVTTNSYPPATPAPSGAPSSYPAASSAPPGPAGARGRMVVDAWQQDAGMGGALAEVPAPAFAVPAVPSQALALGLPPGAALKNGRYRITQRLHGATVHAAPPNEPPVMVASDTELGNERVLVQELPGGAPPAEMDAWRRACAERFANLTQQVGAPRLIDQFGESGRHFLVYELPSGDLLSDRLQRTRGTLDEKQAIGIALQVLDILAVYERQYPAFIHGNICPANIVLRPSGQVALVGFSPALLLYADGIVPQGTAGGAPGYAAPEQARGQASPRSDLFSLCAVLHQCVTGVAPSPRARGMFAPARQANPHVSLELADVLSQGLRLASTQRYQTSGDLRRALQPLARGQLTHVPDDLGDDEDDDEPAPLLPVRDARGRLVLPRKRRRQSPALILALIVLLIALAGGTTLYVLSPRGGRGGALATPTTNASIQLFQTQGIGLSGGEFIFDTSSSDTAAKQQGAQALNAGDLATAEAAFTQAEQQDNYDPEAAIYAEDVRVLRTGAPYVTVVAAVSYSDLDATQEVLQGIYLAQRRTNASGVLPAGLQVRVLILNSAQDDSTAATAANLLVQDVQHGNVQHLLGIVGWPESPETIAALSVLRQAGLALISPTATGVHLAGSATYFFSLVPSDAQQAAELAQAAVAAPINATQILVLADSASPTSVAEQQSFLSALRGESGVVSHTARYTSGNAGSLRGAANLSASQGDDLIFLACGDTGCDGDSLTLAQAVEGTSGTGPGAPRILATEQAFTPALLGVGSDPVATFARSIGGAVQLLDVTELASFDEWTAMHVPSEKQPSLATDWEDRFGYGGSQLPDGLQGPSAASILAYDALRLLLSAAAQLTHQQGTSIVYPTPTQIREDGLPVLFTAAHPFVGVGGAVAFSETGDLVGKSLVIARLIPLNNSGSGPVAQPQIVTLTGGVQAFCTASCTPS